MHPDSMPIMQSILRRQEAKISSFPWGIIAPHERQAQINHGQTLKRLAERGGLSPCELVAILEDRHWRKMPEDEALLVLAEILSKATEDLMSHE